VICVVILFRNAPPLAERCLASLRASIRQGAASFLLIDDCSAPASGIVPLLVEFRNAVAPMDVRIVRFKRQMHYSHGLSYALSLVRPGADVLFVSHDMMLTPDCVAALSEQLLRDAGIGIVRPTSEHMDWARSLVALPPTPVSTFDHAAAFAREIRQRFGSEAVDWPMLIGDAMLIRDEVISRIGVFDPRYFGFMGDIDYGVRARRANFRHGIARGAWLHHEGAGTAREAGDELAKGEGMKRLVESAYEEFCRKWGQSHLPPYFRDMRREHFDALHALPPMQADERIAPLLLTPDIGEEV
jgi:GT2 family glycosyltransferase